MEAGLNVLHTLYKRLRILAVDRQQQQIREICHNVINPRLAALPVKQRDIHKKPGLSTEAVQHFHIGGKQHHGRRDSARSAPFLQQLPPVRLQLE
ncbi:hypothetical protein D3C71_1949280 [compost metagenome]